MCKKKCRNACIDRPAAPSPASPVAVASPPPSAPPPCKSSVDVETCKDDCDDAFDECTGKKKACKKRGKKCKKKLLQKNVEVDPTDSSSNHPSKYTAATRKLLSRTCSNPKVHCSNPKVAPVEQLSGFLQSDFRLAAVYFAIVHCNATAVVTDSPDVARHPIAAR
eukprot:scaffold19240_cov53-Phaeocystis_antarctica.AAC.4